MISITEVQYKTFGRCVCISNNIIEMYVTVEFGPRIIRFGFCDKQNFLWEDPDFSIKFDVSQSKFDEDVTYLRGGHRLWASPESAPRVRYPDNKEVSYSVNGSKVTFVQPTQEANEFQLSIEIDMSETSNEVTINHSITNTSYWPKKYGVWPITVMADGGVEYAALNTDNTALMPNRHFALWRYSKMNDPRVVITDKYLSLRYDNSVGGAFKIGFSQNRPWAVYFLGGDMFVKRYTPISGETYPDMGSTYETYTDSKVLEMECMGPVREIESQGVNSFSEKWQLFENVDVAHSDEDMDTISQKYELE